MISRLRSKLNYSNVIASIALFVAFSGIAVAAGLPKNSVGANQIKRGAVTAAKIKKGAVTSGKLGPKSVTAGKLGPNAILPGNIGNGAITSDKLGAGSVLASTIKNGVVTTNKLANDSVTNGKLATNSVNTGNIVNGSITAAKLNADIPQVATLKSGQTLRGVFDLGGTAGAKDGEVVRSSVSFLFPLLSGPAVTVLQKGETSANCSGVGGGAAQTPQATVGNLCVYITESANLEPAAKALAVENNTRLGFGLVATAKEKEAPYYAYGQWAVTAP
jgi:hypothetical protein